MKVNIFKCLTLSLLLCSIQLLYAGRIYDEFEEKKNNKKDLSILRLGAIIPVPPTQNLNSSQQDKSRKYLKHTFSKL